MEHLIIAIVILLFWLAVRFGPELFIYLFGSQHKEEGTLDIIAGPSGASYYSISQDIRRSKNRYINMTIDQRESNEGKELREHVFKLEKELKGIDSAMGWRSSPRGNYTSDISETAIGKHEEERE